MNQIKRFGRKIVLATTGAACLALGGVGTAYGNTVFDRPNIFFDNPQDTIEISGQTWLGAESTYEARIYFPSNVGAFGFVFNEFTDSYEDKTLAAGPSSLFGFNFPLYTDNVLTTSISIATDTWHHIAFVQGGGTQRLYLDGQIVASRPGVGDIWDSNGGGFLGAISRNGNVYNSFIGHLDTLRISNVARYSGNSFEIPLGDLSSDSSTQILYNFNLEDYFQQNSLTWVSDLSGNGHHGRFGTGFAGATSPSIIVPIVPVDRESVPEPSSTLCLLAFGACGAGSLLKRFWQQKDVDS
ncbi:MAG TPA: hypothetical protein DDZ80_17840 [Cyanobacteria bacterium UBA8803]|nr:hypothetical protein [Cyanobacteria bacterium UBA9273]HBL60247.1 hypothetical protein [Cyanobacteria bacterium UBA8803]